MIIYCKALQSEFIVYAVYYINIKYKVLTLKFYLGGLIIWTTKIFLLRYWLSQLLMPE